jgi:hypothetical protein
MQIGSCGDADEENCEESKIEADRSSGSRRDDGVVPGGGGQWLQRCGT